jgi:putative glutamine amidotransferase
MKKIIGIIPKSVFGDETVSTFSDTYISLNNYAKRVAEAGGIPITLTPVDNRLSQEQMDLCDAFVVQGGAEFYFYHYQLMHYAFTHKKRYLGICLGSQLIYVYRELRRRMEEQGYTGDLVEAIYAYVQAQGPSFTVQQAIPGHRCQKVLPRGSEDQAKHDVQIVPGTLLHRVLGRDTMRIASYHDLNTPPTQTLVTINAWSALGDGVVEGVEYGDHILGVQGHPEVDTLLPELFRFVVGE